MAEETLGCGVSSAKSSNINFVEAAKWCVFPIVLPLAYATEAAHWAFAKGRQLIKGLNPTG